MARKIEISHRTIIFTVLFLIFLWFLYQIRHVLLIFFIGIILMSSLNPLVLRLEKLRIPRVLAAIIIYLTILVIVGLVLAGLIPPLVFETGNLINRLPEYASFLNIQPLEGGIVNSQLNQLLAPLGSLSVGVVRTTLDIFGGFVIIFTLIFVSFYMLLERINLEKYLNKLFGSTQDKKIALVIYKIEKRLGDWVRAQITLMIIVGLMCFVGLRFLGIDYALPLALVAGILEVMPNIGPMLSAIPAVLAGLAISPLMALAVAALYFLVQQLENQIIVPQVMKRETGVNPLITIFALIAGFKIGGVLGAVLAIPFVIVIETILSEIFTSESFKKTA